MYLVDQADELASVSMRYKSSKDAGERNSLYEYAIALGQVLGLSVPEVCSKLGRAYDPLAEELAELERNGQLSPELVQATYDRHMKASVLKTTSSELTEARAIAKAIAERSKRYARLF